MKFHKRYQSNFVKVMHESECTHTRARIANYAHIYTFTLCVAVHILKLDRYVEDWQNLAQG